MPLSPSGRLALSFASSVNPCRQDSRGLRGQGLAYRTAARFERASGDSCVTDVKQDDGGNNRLPRGSLCHPEKHRKRPVNRKHDILVEPADGWPELWAAHGLRTVDGDLRRDPQAILTAWRDIDPRNGGVPQAAGQRQYHDSRKRIEPVRLNNHSGAWFTAVPLQGNDNNVAAACQPRSSQASALTRSQNSASVRPSSVPSAFAIRSHWRRHSAAKLAARVSGTQICTGRSPEARILSRRRLTRSALVSLFMRLHVAWGRRANKASHNRSTHRWSATQQ
jgi:hypothetical protein